MRKTTIIALFISLLSTFSSHAQQTKPTAIEKEKLARLLIDMACFFNEQFKSPKAKAWQADKISDTPIPAILPEVEFEKQLLLFRKSLSHSKFFQEDGQFMLHYDGIHAPNASATTQYEFLCQKMTTDKGKTKVLTNEKPVSLTFFNVGQNAVQTPFKAKEKIVKIEGELIVKHHANFQTLTLTKADIGKTKVFNGVNIRLKSLENGFCSYESDQKDPQTISVCYFSKSKERLATENSQSILKALYEPILSDYKYDAQTGCSVSNDVRKRFEALTQDLDEKKIKDRTMIYRTIAVGTIDYLTFYAPYDLKIKRYKVEVYPQFRASDSRDNDTFQLKQERYLSTKFNRKFDVLTDIQLKSAIKTRVKPELNGSDPPTRIVEIVFPSNENTHLAKAVLTNLKGSKNGQPLKLDAKIKQWGDYIETNTATMIVPLFDELQGQVEVKYPASFQVTRMLKADLFDKIAFEKKEAERIKKAEEREKREEKEGKQDEEEEKEEENKPEPVHAFILKSKNILSVLQKTTDGQAANQYAIIRAFDKDGLELLVENNGSNGFNFYQDYLIWGDMASIKVYEIKAWIEMTVPFKLMP